MLPSCSRRGFPDDAFTPLPLLAGLGASLLDELSDRASDLSSPVAQLLDALGRSAARAMLLGCFVVAILLRSLRLFAIADL